MKTNTTITKENTHNVYSEGGLPFSDFSLLEQKMFLAIIDKYYSETFEPEKRYFLTATDYALAIKSNTDGNYQRFESVCKSIRNKGFRLNSNSEKTEELYLKRSRYLKEQQRLENGEKGLIIQFNPLFNEYCNNLKNRFYKGQIQAFVKLSSQYAFPIVDFAYQFLNLDKNSYENLSNNTTLKIEISVEEFRNKFGLNDRLLRFSDLKSRVIRPATKSLKDAEEAIGFSIEMDNKTTNKKIILNFNKPS